MEEATRTDVRREPDLCHKCKVRPEYKTDGDGVPVCEKCALGLGEPFRVKGFRIGRNDRCPCGSGKKFKHCHWTGDKYHTVTPVGNPYQSKVPHPAESADQPE